MKEVGRFLADELRYWPWCMIDIANRKDSAEACGGPTTMPGQPIIRERPDISWEVGAKALLNPPEIKAYTLPPQPPPPRSPPTDAA